MKYLVDKEDEELVGSYTWHETSEGYLRTKARKKHKEPTGRGILMHRLIMGAAEGTEIDHINRDKKDNRKSNLRFATRGLNTINRGLRKDNKSGVVGVSYSKKSGRWQVRVQDKHYGWFDNLLDAVAHRMSLNYDIDSA